MRIVDATGAPWLGPYRGQDSGWGHHEVVVRNGRVYDAWTDRYGEPIEEYAQHWPERAYHKMIPTPE
ncbi:hypothetical protein T261_8450 [Streptomyces lydicus]|nr:hypothetical protein T261_8450 [Streptomyces lydicus]